MSLDTRTDEPAAADVLRDILLAPESMTENLAKVRRLRDDYVPPEYATIMDRAIDDLARENIRRAALKIGDRCPEFALPDTGGCEIRAGDILQKGPLVISFYRGSWCPYCNIELRASTSSLPSSSTGTHGNSAKSSRSKLTVVSKSTLGSCLTCRRSGGSI